MMSVCAQWRTGRQGTLAPVEQAKLWALREVLRMLGEDDDQYQWMSGLVQVVGGGTPGPPIKILEGPLARHATVPGSPCLIIIL